MEKPTQVLVVGAGPVGLLCAFALATADIQVTIVDAAYEPGIGGRAVAIHASTLDTLNTIGIADDLVKVGIKSTGVQLYDGSQPLLAISNAPLQDRTAYPFILLLPQHLTERTLSSRLSSVGIEVQWQLKAVSMTPSDGGVQVGFENGSSITAQYVIGADGSRSTVRTLLGLSFNDPDTGERYDDAASQDYHPRILTVADIVLREPLPPSWSKEKLSLHTGGGQLIISVPLPLTSYPPSLIPRDGELSFWRVVILWERGTPLPPSATTIEYVESRISLVHDNPTVEVVAVLNGNRYRVRNALVETMYKPLGQGHVLLAGDSAHAFSPAGGQGLNLGFCDAVALARAVSVHIQSKEAKVLRNYSRSRRDKARYVINLANNTFKGYQWLMNTYPFLRRVFAFIMNHIKFLQSRLILKVSGLDTTVARGL